LTFSQAGAQIQRMPIYYHFARGAYLTTIICAPLFVVGASIYQVQSMSFARVNLGSGTASSLAFVAALLALYCAPAYRAWARLARLTELLPAPLVRESPIIVSMVSFASILGTLLFFLVCAILIPLTGVDRPPEDIGKVIIVIFPMLVLYGFALITAEWVLMGTYKTA
jgi:hypothetical protein